MEDRAQEGRHREKSECRRERWTPGTDLRPGQPQEADDREEHRASREPAATEHRQSGSHPEACAGREDASAAGHACGLRPERVLEHAHHRGAGGEPRAHAGQPDPLSERIPGDDVDDRRPDAPGRERGGHGRQSERRPDGAPEQIVADGPQASPQGVEQPREAPLRARRAAGDLLFQSQGDPQGDRGQVRVGIEGAEVREETLRALPAVGPNPREARQDRPAEADPLERVVIPHRLNEGGPERHPAPLAPKPPRQPSLLLHPGTPRTTRASPAAAPRTSETTRLRPSPSTRAPATPAIAAAAILRPWESSGPAQGEPVRSGVPAKTIASPAAVCSAPSAAPRERAAAIPRAGAPNDPAETRDSTAAAVRAFRRR